MSSIVKSVVPLHPEKVWEDVSPGFLVTFWSLTLYDLCVPNEAYKREINKLKAQSAAMGDSKQAVSYYILLDHLLNQSFSFFKKKLFMISQYILVLNYA